MLRSLLRWSEQRNDAHRAIDAGRKRLGSVHESPLVNYSPASIVATGIADTQNRLAALAQLSHSNSQRTGQQEYLHMLPLVCNDAVALLFMFDLSRKSTLTSVKQWYKQSRLLNKTATPFLIGTKYDYFSNMKLEEKREMTLQARRFAKAMRAPLIFCSSSHSINIHKIFKIVLSKVFELKCSVEQITQIGDPIIEYEEDASVTQQQQSQQQQQQSSDQSQHQQQQQQDEEKQPAINALSSSSNAASGTATPNALQSANAAASSNAKQTLSASTSSKLSSVANSLNSSAKQQQPQSQGQSQR